MSSEIILKFIIEKFKEYIYFTHFNPLFKRMCL